MVKCGVLWGGSHGGCFCNHLNRKMQIPESKLNTVRGKTIGIGRLKIPKTVDFDYEIPLLSFIVIEREDGDYISSCVHLQIDGYGRSVEGAQRDMLDNVLYFLDKNFNSEDYKEHCWENLLDLFEANEDSSALWDRYHAVQIMLAERGRTTDHQQYSQARLFRELLRKIEELESRVRELELENRMVELVEERMKNQEGQGGCRGSRFVSTLKATKEMPIVEYINVQMGVA